MIRPSIVFIDLEGNRGNDILKGGDDFDTYRFNTGTGEDTIDDSDGLGQIFVGEQLITGAGNTKYQLVNGNKVWTDTQGFRYELNRLNELVITEGGLETSDKITIKNYEVNNNTLGIQLNIQPAVAFLAGNEANPFYQPDPDLQTASSEVNENSAQNLKIALNQSAKAGDTIVISATGFDATLLSLTTGADTLNMGDGPVELTLREGQTEVTFMIANTGDIDTTAHYTLSATWQPLDNNSQSVSSDYNLTVHGQEEAEANLNTPDRLTDSADYHAPSTTTAYVMGQDGHDMLFGSAGSDQLSGGSGDDWINGSGGKDIISGGDGNDHISGIHSGSVATGGTGNDLLSGLFDDVFTISNPSAQIAASTFWSDFA